MQVGSAHVEDEGRASILPISYLGQPDVLIVAGVGFRGRFVGGAGLREGGSVSVVNGFNVLVRPQRHFYSRRRLVPPRERAERRHHGVAAAVVLAE